jgi:hypothetical protein
VVLPALAALLLFGLCDQYCAQYMVSRYPSDEQHYRTVSELVARLESALPAGAAVYQLPYTRYPVTPVAYHMPSNEHLVAYVTSRSLRWSWPALTASATRWNEKVCDKPAPELASTLALAGFDAIWIDATGYEDGGAALIHGLGVATGAPLVATRDGRYTVFGLAAVKTHLMQSMSASEYGEAVSRALSDEEREVRQIPVPNGDFESGVMGPWVSYLAVRAGIGTEHVHSGRFSVSEAAAKGSVYIDVQDLEPGLTYTVSAWVYGSPQATATAQIAVYDPAVNIAIWSETIDPKPVWQLLKYTFRKQSRAFTRIHLFRNDGDGTLFWDDVRVAQIE